ncbi:hypothetical protein C7B80_04510 [Cyanosarcina cf. burmensis CCALA 770]|nr:hypothetical protein C7B80_04510 [Cyanosarcina cf. burmensis CCALA 770]
MSSSELENRGQRLEHARSHIRDFIKTNQDEVVRVFQKCFGNQKSRDRPSLIFSRCFTAIDASGRDGALIVAHKIDRKMMKHSENSRKKLICV